MKTIASLRYAASKTSDYIFRLLVLFGVLLCLFGFIVQNPLDVLRGLWTLIQTPSGLITDYTAVAGLGSAFVNAGLVTLLSLAVLRLTKLPFSGVSISCVFLMAGFSLFGKNLYNILPILLGGFLYAKFQREPFARFAYPVLFGSSLAPAALEIALLFNLSPIGTFLCVNAIGLVIGFLLPAVSWYTLRVHQGYDLYNVGFAAGLIGLLATAFLRSQGHSFTARLVWSNEYTLHIGIFLCILCLIMLGLGFYLNGFSFSGLRRVMRHSGRTVADFIMLDGLPVSLINMGLVGLMAIGYVLLVGGPLNGPVTGGILTIIGFGALGKHPKNIVPVVLGVVLTSLVTTWGLSEPSMLLAALFATGLAPISGQFGPLWGVVAGALHSVVTRDISFLHGWLNLYNNGFSAGIVCIVLVPLIEAFRNEEE